MQSTVVTDRRLLFSHILCLIPLFSGFIIKGRLKNFQTTAFLSFTMMALPLVKKLSCIF
jgi:hypothetical protein